MKKSQNILTFFPGDEIRIDDKFNTFVTAIIGNQVWFEDDYYMHCNDPRIQLIKKAIQPKVIFGQGLFIRKDDFGQNCHIGDKVEVIRPEMEILSDEVLSGIITMPEITFTGILVLLKSKGVMLRCDRHHHFTGYIKPPLTNRSRNIWKWRKL